MCDLFMLYQPQTKEALTLNHLSQGTINRESGEVSLDFDCEFFFTIGPLYVAPPLVINTLLTTETTRGRFRDGIGSRLNGKAVK